jgi:hypothetical protein
MSDLRMFVGLVALVLASSTGAHAEDIWDRTGNDDSAATTRTEIAPGELQVHDLEAVGVRDEDFFRLSLKPYSSYEVLVDGLTGGLAVVPVTAPIDELWVYLVDASGTGFAGSSALGASGSARVMYFRNETGTAIDDRYIRVAKAVCQFTCTASEQYRIRLFDTTYGISRFNNSATQVTVLVIQNTSDRPVYFNATFFDSNGALLGVRSHTLNAFGSFVFNTSTLASVAGKSGSIVINNDGRYGVLTGKAVSLEPATGFTFDTLMVARGQ